jgi:hypothetical protein
MIRNLIAVTATLLFVASASAGPKEDVVEAAKKLADGGNYSWKSTVEAQFGAGVTEGKTQKDGLTWLTINRGDTTTEVLLKGENAAIKTDGTWKSLQEVQDEQGPARFTARMVQGFKPPATIVQEVAGKVKELGKTDGDAYSAALPEETAKELLTFGGRRAAGANAPTISNAKGNVKVWLKDGQLVKLQLQLQGSINIQGQDRDVDRTTTTEFKDVGTTKIDAPAEAKAKAKLP